MQTVSDFMLDRLGQWGVQRVFGYPGDGINGLIGAFGRNETLEFVQTRHEEGAAFMACAFYRGIRLGVLDAETFRAPADRAFAAMSNNLDADGNLQGVSAAVYAALVQEHYWHVPRGYIVPWGQGPVLTAALARVRVDQA